MNNFRSWLSYNLRYYFSRPPWDTGVSPPELIKYIAENTAGRALDLGCGTGTNLLTLAQAGWQVTGIDFAAEAIRRARRRFARAGLQADLHVGDVTHLEALSGPFDLALDIGCFHSLGEDGRRDYLSGLLRLLRPGGTWLVYAHCASPAALYGLREAEIAGIATALRLASRANSSDRRGRPSVWLEFKK